MHEERDAGDSFSESNLDSAEYRERLKRKLNCLIAVLEVATAKVKQSLAGPAPDIDRLTRIQKNLQDTLDVCMRARSALDKRGTLPESLSQDLAAAVNPSMLGAAAAPKSEPRTQRPAARGPENELSAGERAKFKSLPKIDRSMIGTCDLDELSRLLQG
ncbi:MAG: hypothetical protein IT454_20145 [Planctomycetes bacterium]|nr:hypothetical protein [Planctomycetota bacterium]